MAECTASFYIVLINLHSTCMYLSWKVPFVLQLWYFFILGGVCVCVCLCVCVSLVDQPH